MVLNKNKIELSDTEKQAFIKQFKKGVFCQLHKEKLLNDEQLNQALKSLDN